ncbi:hypothetical protein NQZ68_020264 [Dissostichus eleginoides]|nr:hypothetical protein NQZ68_020264 [Dissostichus eleginoides]
MWEFWGIYHQTLTYMNPPSVPPKCASEPYFHLIKIPKSGCLNQEVYRSGNG